MNYIGFTALVPAEIGGGLNARYPRARGSERMGVPHSGGERDDFRAEVVYGGLLS